jgi:hypothetical protein
MSMGSGINDMAQKKLSLLNTFCPQYIFNSPDTAGKGLPFAILNIPPFHQINNSGELEVIAFCGLSMFG